MMADLVDQYMAHAVAQRLLMLGPVVQDRTALRSPALRLIVALIFAAPATVAGYALVHGVTREAVPSEVRRQIFCVIGGGFVGVSALVRLAGDVTRPAG
jgi:hypothetical protein